VLLLVLGIATTYVGWHLDRGWVPLDEGSLAHAAQRVLLGELPHRDFDDVYTGGLAYLNAAAFRLLGTTLLSMRLALFAVFLAWVPAVYYIALRFVRPMLAGGVTLLAVVWSLPNYSAPMPSWYNLFLATFGIAALLRFLEDGRRRWLVAAGVAGGVSFLVKVIGLYYVAGVLLFLVFHAHSLTGAQPGTTARGRGYAVFTTVSLLLFVAALGAVVRRQLSAPAFAHFILPSALVAGLLVRNEWSDEVGRSRARFASLVRLVAPFLAGVAFPAILFLLPYIRSGSVGAFAYGVFVLPAKRLSFAAAALPLVTLVALLPVGALVALIVRAVRSPEARRPFGRREAIVLAGVLATIVIASGSVESLYRMVLLALRAIVPVLAVTTVVLLMRDRDRDAAAALRRGRLMVLLSVTVVCSLVQFPFSAAIYFCYVAPLIALTTVAFFAYLNRPVPLAIPALALAFGATFAVVRLNDSPLNDMDRHFLPYPDIRRLALDRGGLTVPLFQAGQYETAVAILREHAHGEYIWASPDAPQLYFLTGYRNPTRSLFEFLDDTTGRTAKILHLLDSRHVNVVALNVVPEFSPRISMGLYRELAKRYPNSALVSPYLIKWRD
jgi:fermentation-respiration switch protein FrsA (DUF1100 family)